ncbi:FusB/FusC family EF-G-binding protein [Metabacillus sp. KIGAM252]|uniref:FusB/FusC family EF-G-binding protein n=1 Tax=Metabacillus flavus TaxID=2823519 RepID=A0ABS5LB28_9BACI|nr:FusB/FusC family EF-G-binding protein [Metabacillus flavus]
MEPFIRTDQYHYIKSQAQNLVNGHATANDQGVLKAVRELARENVLNLMELNEEQQELLLPITEIKERGDAELFTAAVKSYVIPFPELTEAAIKRTFPKAKKLKAPAMEELDLKELTYLSWIDKGSDKMFIIAPYKGKLKGLQGTYDRFHKKGICTICHGYEEIGMFMTEIKGKVQGTFVKRGNYICRDSLNCNQNLTSLDRLEDLFELLG